MSAPEGCFFGEKVTRDVSKKIDVKEGLLLHISHACLDHTSKGPVSLVVNNGGNDYVICTLKDYGHASLDLNFSSSFILKVKGEGKNAIHVSGYWEFVADPEMGMMEEDEEEEEEEEEEVAAPPVKKAKAAAVKESPKQEAKKSPKQEAKKSPQQEAIQATAKAPIPDDDDEESMTPSMLEMLAGMAEEFEEFEEEEEDEDEEVPVPTPAPAVGKKRVAPAAVSAPAKTAPPAKKAKTEAPAKKQAPPQNQNQNQGKKNKKGGRK